MDVLTKFLILLDNDTVMQDWITDSGQAVKTLKLILCRPLLQLYSDFKEIKLLNVEILEFHVEFWLLTQQRC